MPLIGWRSAGDSSEEGTINTSERIDELAAALAKAQGQFPAVTKDSAVNTGKYGYRYADLASYLDAIRQPMAANGLAIIQAPYITGDGVTVTTMLAHASGQWIQNDLSMPVTDSRPQTLGAIITYCRRYSLTAMLNLAAEDDDGQGQQRVPPVLAQAEPQAHQAAEAPDKASPSQLKALHAAGNAFYGKNWDTKRHELVKAITAGRTESSTDLTVDEALRLIHGINQKADAQAAMVDLFGPEP
jgi:hypothetical protein